MILLMRMFNLRYSSYLHCTISVYETSFIKYSILEKIQNNVLLIFEQMDQLELI